jgi:hypothetical protein
MPVVIGGVLSNSSPLHVTGTLSRSVAISHHLGEQGFARYRTKHCNVLALPPTFFFSSFCILPLHCAEVATNLGPVPDLIAVRARWKQVPLALRTTILTKEAAR